MLIKKYLFICFCVPFGCSIFRAAKAEHVVRILDLARFKPDALLEATPIFLSGLGTDMRANTSVAGFSTLPGNRTPGSGNESTGSCHWTTWGHGFE